MIFYNKNALQMVFIKKKCMGNDFYYENTLERISVIKFYLVSLYQTI